MWLIEETLWGHSCGTACEATPDTGSCLAAPRLIHPPTNVLEKVVKVAQLLGSQTATWQTSKKLLALGFGFTQSSEEKTSACNSVIL